ncbi:hypothetical protein ACGFNV_07450 [Streptomyces sp. NPDC048751]|uniref:hypothetical protein n=1 Tax=Streptomyces sp. NPDC048751 TaxID=3365591 RepID=UPI00370FD105
MHPSEQVGCTEGDTSHDPDQRADESRLQDHLYEVIAQSLAVLLQLSEQCLSAHRSAMFEPAVKQAIKWPLPQVHAEADDGADDATQDEPQPKYLIHCGIVAA